MVPHMSVKNPPVTDQRRAICLALGRKLLALDVDHPEDERFWRPTVTAMTSVDHPNHDGIRVSYHRMKNPDMLSDEQAQSYLDWLEAGNVGHFEDMRGA